MDAWRWMEAHQLGAAIARGEINPVALTETFLDAIANTPQSPRIFTQVTAARARHEAEGAAARARAGKLLSPLDGVPISWKDNIDSAGDIVEGGSAVLEGRRAESDALVLARATEAGLVCLGKTQMTELAFSGLGVNVMRETAPHHDRPGAVPGGSSSGAAAALRFGLAAASIGTDTGGSIRLPAAWNDLVGFKPAYDSVPMTGILPLAQSFDQVGPLARSVTDAAAIHAILAGQTLQTLQALPPATGQLRLLVMEGVALTDLEPEPLTAFNEALAHLAAGGARIERFHHPALDEGFALTGPLTTAEAWANWGEIIEAQPEALSPRIRTRFQMGAAVRACDYIRGQRRLTQLRAEIGEAMGNADALILPSVPFLPPAKARLDHDEAAFTAANLRALRNTRFGNMLGGPALTVPTGHAGCGLMLLRLDPDAAAMLGLGRVVEAALAGLGKSRAQ